MFLIEIETKFQMYNSFNMVGKCKNPPKYVIFQGVMQGRRQNIDLILPPSSLKSTFRSS